MYLIWSINVLHYINSNNLNIKAGFIHVPFMDSQVQNKLENSLPIDTILEAVLDSIKASIE